MCLATLLIWHLKGSAHGLLLDYFQALKVFVKMFWSVCVCMEGEGAGGDGGWRGRGN